VSKNGITFKTTIAVINIKTFKASSDIDTALDVLTALLSLILLAPLRGGGPAGGDGSGPLG
jgi:hypothetical protein